MRSLAIAVAIVAASTWAIVRHLPENEAEAETVGRAQEVQSVALEGRGLPIAALRTALATRAGDQHDASKLDHDRTALAAELTARGYLAAKVGVPQVTFDTAGRAFVTFAIELGAVFHVRSGKVIGATPREAGVVTLAAGEVAMADRIARTRDALATRLSVRGKQTAVALRVAPDEAAAAVDVELVAR